MTLNIWRFLAIMLTAVAMTAAFAHLMELPAKMTFDARHYVMLHRTLYPNFGRIAGTAEFLAVVAVIGLAWQMRRKRGAFLATAIGAALMVAAHGVFWALVQPANVTMAAWPLDQIPAGWEQWRDRWEYSHAARAFLILASLAALVGSVLVRTESTGRK